MDRLGSNNQGAGRRTLLLIGSLGYIVSLGLCAWAFATQSFSYVSARIFAFFAGMMMLQLLWVLTMVPETKGVPLEQLAEQLQG
ncbi:MAG: MFS transporter [Planctomycetia bacterium]|nr:MFS transporter [Planctomycetia bacterium]